MDIFRKLVNRRQGLIWRDVHHVNQVPCLAFEVSFRLIVRPRFFLAVIWRDKKDQERIFDKSWSWCRREKPRRQSVPPGAFLLILAMFTFITTLPEDVHKLTLPFDVEEIQDKKLLPDSQGLEAPNLALPRQMEEYR